MPELETDTYYEYTGVTTTEAHLVNTGRAEGGYSNPLRQRVPYTSFQFTGNCGASQVYSLEDFNCKERGYIKGTRIFLNPDKEKVADVPGTHVDFVQCGKDVVAVRITTDPTLAWGLAV